MMKPFLQATFIVLVFLATLAGCSDPTPAPETLAPGLHTGTDGVPDADGDPGTHGGPDGETHRRAQGDAGQFYDSRTNSNSGAPRGTGSPPVTGLRGNALRAIRR